MKKKDEKIEINLGIVESINDFIRGLGKFSVIVVILMIIIIAFMFKTIWDMSFGRVVKNNDRRQMTAIERLEEIYSSEKFEIVSEEIRDDKKYYKVKSIDKQIEFTVIDGENGLFVEDYWQNRLKYEIGNMEDRNLYDKLKK